MAGLSGFSFPDASPGKAYGGVGAAAGLLERRRWRLMAEDGGGLADFQLNGAHLVGLNRAALRATGEFDDVAVLGVPDAEWGEAVVACYPATARAPDLERVTQALVAQLAPPARPKRYVAVADWPRNAQGKLNRALLAEKIKV